MNSISLKDKKDCAGYLFLLTSVLRIYVFQRNSSVCLNYRIDHYRVVHSAAYYPFKVYGACSDGPYFFLIFVICLPVFFF